MTEDCLDSENAPFAVKQRLKAMEEHSARLAQKVEQLQKELELMTDNRQAWKEAHESQRIEADTLMKVIKVLSGRD